MVTVSLSSNYCLSVPFFCCRLSSPKTRRWSDSQQARFARPLVHFRNGQLFRVSSIGTAQEATKQLCVQRAFINKENDSTSKTASSVAPFPLASCICFLSWSHWGCCMATIFGVDHDFVIYVHLWRCLHKWFAVHLWSRCRQLETQSGMCTFSSHSYVLVSEFDLIFFSLGIASGLVELLNRGSYNSSCAGVAGVIKVVSRNDFQSQ